MLLTADSVCLIFLQSLAKCKGWLFRHQGAILSSLHFWVNLGKFLALGAKELCNPHQTPFPGASEDLRYKCHHATCPAVRVTYRHRPGHMKLSSTAFFFNQWYGYHQLYLR